MLRHSLFGNHISFCKLLVLGLISGALSQSQAQVAQEASELLWRRSADGLLMKDNGAESEGMSHLVGSKWKLSGYGDMNGDGVRDLLWRNENSGALFVHYIGGEGNNERIGGGYLSQTVGLDWSVVGLYDFTGDNKADVVWRSESRLWYKLKDGSLSGGQFVGVEGALGLNWSLEGLEDMNVD